jgi:hypothetical protein
VILGDDKAIIAPELREWQASRPPPPPPPPPGSDAHDPQPAEEPLIQLESQPPSRASSAVAVVTPTSSAAGDHHHWAYFSPASSTPAAEQEHVHHAAATTTAAASHPRAAEVPPATTTTAGSTYFSINEWAESATPSFQRHAQRHADTHLGGAHAQRSGSNGGSSDGVQSSSPSPPNGRQLRPTPISVPTSDIAPQDSHGRRGDVDTRSATVDHSDGGHVSDTDNFGNSDDDDDYGAQTRLADEVLSFTTGTAASTTGVRTPGTWTEVGSEVSENDIGP